MRLALVVLALWIGAWTTSAVAQPAPAPPAPEPAPPTTGAAEPVERIPLSLGEAIALGIENNTNVQLVRYDPPIAEYDYEAAWGLHDPTLYSDYTYQSTKVPVASTFFPGQFVERDSLGDAGLRGLVPRLGWTYQVGYTGESLATNSAVQTLGTSYTSNLTASVTAPLLKGAWWGAAWTQVEVTGIESELALEQFRQRLMDIVGGPPDLPLEVKVEQSLGIENAYWTLAARKQELEVATKSLETSRALLEQTKAQQQEMLDRARRDIETEKNNAIAALRREAVDLAIAGASKVIERNLDSDANRKLVETFLGSVSLGGKA